MNQQMHRRAPTVVAGRRTAPRRPPVCRLQKTGRRHGLYSSCAAASCRQPATLPHACHLPHYHMQKHARPCEAARPPAAHASCCARTGNWTATGNRPSDTTIIRPEHPTPLPRFHSDQTPKHITFHWCPSRLNAFATIEQRATRHPWCHPVTPSVTRSHPVSPQSTLTSPVYCTTPCW